MGRVRRSTAAARLKNGLDEYNLRVIVSGSGAINPNAEIFKRRFSPIIILTTRGGSENKLKKLLALADDLIDLRRE